MFNWLREFYELRRENKICQSCETLKMQLAIANDEKKQLLNRLLEKPEPEVVRTEENLQPIVPRHVPWSMRKQALETEARDRARRLKENSTPEITIKDLEDEIINAGTERKDGTN